LKDFLKSFTLPDLHPDAQTVKHATGTIPRVLSNPRHEYGIYLDGDGPTKVTLDLPAGHYSGAWMNVKTGSFERSVDIQATGGDTLLNHPTSNEIALRLKRVAH
jgi:hypothetical protein